MRVKSESLNAIFSPLFYTAFAVMSSASSVASSLTSSSSDPLLEGQEESINGTCFDLEARVLPQTFATRKKKNYNRVTRTVVRIVVVKLNVRARARTPEGMTFVPLFVTDDDLLLEPDTCDIVGNCVNSACHLNPSFVLKKETSPRRVKAMAVNFDIKPEDMDSFPIDFDMPSSDSYSHPVARKVAAKTFPSFQPIKCARKEYSARPHCPSLDSSEGEEEEGGEEEDEGGCVSSGVPPRDASSHESVQGL